MSLADCSLVENPSLLEATTQQESNNGADETAANLLQDTNPPLQNVKDVESTFAEDNKATWGNHNEASLSKNTALNISNDTDILPKDTATSTPRNYEVGERAENDHFEYIEEIGPYDIICGRNNGAHNWVGNRRFRITIMMNIKRYTEAPTREEKTQVIKSVISMLQNTEGAGARFIKKVGENTYVRLKDKQIREKVGHAFRDMISLATQEGKLEEKCFQ